MGHAEAERIKQERPAKDEARLDWLEENADYTKTSCGESWWTVNGITRTMLRDAIDAAMGAEE